MARKRTLKKKPNMVWIIAGVIAVVLIVIGVWRRNWVILKIREIINPSPEDKMIPDNSPSRGGFVYSDTLAQKGYKGPVVKKVQETLIRVFGKNVLPKYGADGEWGPETENAVLSKKLPNVVKAGEVANFEITARNPFRT
jgi:hypothetical protein